jgi:colicin import membrane protein
MSTAAAIHPDAFAPRQPPGMRSGLALALVVHALLILAIAWSVRWKASEPEGVVAELWSALPQVAAPRPTPPPPEPKPTPVVEPKLVPPPVDVKPAVTAPQVDAQIAIERAKREQAKRDEAERLEAQKKADAMKREEARRAEIERQRVAAEQAEKKATQQAKQEVVRQAAIREANLKRAMTLAGSSDEADATGTAARTSGPSAGYAGRIKARIKPNILLTAPVTGNPSATVEVQVAPDGTIVGRKLVTSSGVAAWDETVLRAIDKTEVLPKDIDGRVPPTIKIDFRPRE